jgi:hypothetical protein
MSDLINFLGEVKTQLDRSHLAYKSYINDGKKFLYAKILKSSNDEIRNLLLRKTYLLPNDQAKNAVALIHHIDVWSTLWDDAYISLKPSMKSVFVFDNQVNFPAKEVESLFEFYDKIRILSDSTSCKEAT